MTYPGQSSAPSATPVLAVSACLLGEPVRFDGQDRPAKWFNNDLRPHVHLVPICPETEAGMPTPREPVRLVKTSERLSIVGSRSGTDWTAPFEALSRRRIQELTERPIDAFLGVTGSPSCSVRHAKIYGKAGVPAQKGQGLFVQRLLQHNPLLPVESDRRLGDPNLREHFVTRLFARARLRAFFSTNWSVSDLVRFQSQEKFLLMAHSPRGQKLLGQIVARAGARGADRAEIETTYRTLFEQSLAQSSPRGRTTNVLQHILGFFKDKAAPTEKADLVEAILAYRRGYIPLEVPVRMLRSWSLRWPNHWLAGQTFFVPYPAQLHLRAQS
jgi:uncharacterized protein YbgA (DUF1722 family)/uncharacterized protein YbbK (DUF523 family)